MATSCNTEQKVEPIFGEGEATLRVYLVKLHVVQPGKSLKNKIKNKKN